MTHETAALRISRFSAMMPLSKLPGIIEVDSSKVL
jgi:hypothetical protein